MVKSMTGFGRGEYIGEKYNFQVEIKTVNHRYNDISIRMPRYLNFLEESLKKEIQKEIKRGRVDVYINLEYIDDSSLKIDVDMPTAKASMDALITLRDELNIFKDIEIKDIMNVSDVIKIEREIIDEEEIWDCLYIALKEAIEDVVDMKKSEGKALEKDIKDSLRDIEGLIKLIENRAPDVVNEHKERLENRLNEILNEEYEVDQEKLAQEVAIFAEKSDVNEEIIRMNSHINQFYQILDEKEPIGRKLDFLIQEMNREINTIGSKSGDVDITKNVVEIKSKIEKIREQIQNVE